MNDDLRTLIDTSRWCQASVNAFKPLLPPDDGELDALVEEIVADGDGMGFHFVVIAAISAGRVVQARHLEKGAVFFSHDCFLGNCAWHMQGEVAAHLVRASGSTSMMHQHRAMALMIAAAWSREMKPESPLPEDLVPQARLLARTKNLTSDQWSYILAMTAVIADGHLTDLVVSQCGIKTSRDEVLLRGLKLAETLLAMYRKPPSEHVPEEPPRHISSGGPTRRAVARVGRNDPCPCGSGKKYKKCCHDKDQERLHFSTSVAGKTHAELRHEMEAHVTLERLEKMRPYELAHMDPCKLPRKLLPPFLLLLGAVYEFEALASAFERVELGNDLEKSWDAGTLYAGMKGRADIVRRLVRARYREDEPPPAPEELSMRVRLALAQDDPAEFLRTLEAVAKEAATSTDHTLLMDTGYAALFSPYKALGILIARGLLPLVRKRDTVALFDEILRARDLLNISADDPYGDIIEKRFTEEVVDTGKDAEELRKARTLLESKAREVRELKEAREVAMRRLRLMEKNHLREEKSEQARQQAPQESEELRNLRQKVQAMKSDLHARNNERAELRRKLGETYSELHALRGQAAPSPAALDTEDALLGEEVSHTQPLRLLEFPKKFHDTLSSLPRQVARGALELLGRLAGGEPAAFSGVVRLKALPDTLRARIGIDHRLLFRLLPDCVQVVDLINRRDLEKRIKSLGG
jgi:hypothetical protein|nr:SEC-C metal-binding domain-containing protein [Prosthecobacter sp.]